MQKRQERGPLPWIPKGLTPQEHAESWDWPVPYHGAPVNMCLDVGGVLSTKHNTPRGSPIWQNCAPGAFAFCCLFGVKYGWGCLHVVSRVDKYQGGHTRNGMPDHWVGRFLQSIGFAPVEAGGLGVPSENIELCKKRYGPQGKGPILKRMNCTHFVDDAIDCLWSAVHDHHGELIVTIQIKNVLNTMSTD